MGVSAWPLWLSGLLLIVVMPLCAVLAQLGLHRLIPQLAKGEHNDVAGFVIAVVGVIYAVMLGFVVIVSWEKFAAAESIVSQEASALRNIYRESAAFPDEHRERLRSDVLNYATTVIDEEWPAMARGDSSSPAVTQRLDEMFLTITDLPVDTLLEQGFLASEAARFNDLVSARSVRLDYVDQTVPGVLWLALIVGAIVTIGFATIFGLRSTRLHVVITASLATTIGVLLFVSLAVDHAYAGDVAVEPDPLERVLTDFQEDP
jgi:hypothetical protein